MSEPTACSERVLEEIEIFLEKAFSEFARGLYLVLDFHSQRLIGTSLARAIVDKPKEAYHIMLLVLDEPGVEVLSSTLAYMLRRNNIPARANLLRKLSEGDNSAFLEAARAFVDAYRETESIYP